LAAPIKSIESPNPNPLVGEVQFLALLNTGMNSRFPKGYKPWSGEFCNFKQKVDSYRESATPNFLINAFGLML